MFGTPEPPPVRLAATALHYQRYEQAEPGGAFSHWHERELIARLRDVELPRLSPEKTKTAEVWLPFREARAESFGRLDGAERFALRLRLRAPQNVGSAAAVVKLLVDGVVSSLHDHDGSFADGLAKRIGSQVGRSPIEIAELLRQQRDAPLGIKQLVRSRASGVQWAPDDACCVACELIIDRDAAPGMLSLSGELLAIEAR